MGDGQGIAPPETPAGDEGRVEALEAEPRAEVKKLTLAKEIGQALSSPLDLDRLLSLIMEKITLLMQADRSTLYLVSDDGQDLWSKILHADAQPAGGDHRRHPGAEQGRRTVHRRRRGAAGGAGQPGRGLHRELQALPLGGGAEPRAHPDAAAARAEDARSQHPLHHRAG